MDRADRCRRAALEAVADVEPPRLQDVIADVVAEASMTPAVVATESAASIDPDADLEAVTRRAAGVQLIYEGLRGTRALAHEEPWRDDDDAPDADLEILAADILVARGFYLLARTNAAEKAVETVRAFGRTQTLRADAADAEAADRDALDAQLERDVLELAVVTGAAAVGAGPTAELRAAASDLAADVGNGFPPAADSLARFRADSGDGETMAGEGVTTDRATSATDP